MMLKASVKLDFLWFFFSFFFFSMSLFRAVFSASCFVGFCEGSVEELLWVCLLAKKREGEFEF